MSKENSIRRWSILDRLTHLLNLMGFIVALISGLPQLQLTIFDFNVGKNFIWLTDILGGEGIRRILHRYVVTALIGSAITVHVLNFGLRKTKSSILFTYRDFIDLLSYYKYKFFKAPKPVLGFHIPGEKLLYWVAAICIPVLGATGLLMWMRIFIVEYDLLRLTHRITSIILMMFVFIHFMLNLVFREQWQALKAMFINGKVSRRWIEQHHPKAIEEEAISAGRRRIIKMFLWAIPTTSLAYLFSTLLQTSRYEIGEIIIEPSKVMAGRPFTISVEVTNKGYREDTFTIPLLIDNKVIDEKQITLLDGETALLNFKTSINEVGKHLVEINGVSKEFEVVEAPPPIEQEIVERFRRLLPEAYDFIPVMKDGQVSYYEIYDVEGKLIAYGFHKRVYAPTDRLIVTGIVDLNYKIKAVDVDKLKPDIQLLNDKIIEPEFESQFTGITIEDLDISPKGKIDAVSGATISSTKIVEAIKNVLMEIQSSS